MSKKEEYWTRVEKWKKVYVPVNEEKVEEKKEGDEGGG